MKINNVKISNFRALKKMDISLSNMSVIIGENDSGKTSIMLALQYFFDCERITDQTNYFKKDILQPIEIVVTFCEINEAARQYSDGKEQLIIKRTFPYNESPLTEYKKNDQWTKVVSKKIDDILPDFVLVPVERNLESHGKMTTKSLFGKLFRPLIKQVAEEQAAVLTSSLKEIIRLGVARRIDDIQVALIEQLNNQKIRLFHDIDVDILKGIEIPIEMSDERVERIPIEKRGAGIQSNFILALFRVYAKCQTPNFIMAIEEPENSLHPRAQREMRWAMQDFSNNSQVICTTHSPVFLDLGRLEDNIILRRKSDGSTEPSYFNLKDPNELRDVIGIKVSDSLLTGGGNCTLIVEGDTELYAYPHLFQCIGVNPRSIGISVIPAGGSDYKKMIMHAKILKAYNLPCIIVLDQNMSGVVEKIKACKLPNVREIYCLKKGNFEEYLPLEIMIEVINELGSKEWSAEISAPNLIHIGDIDKTKPVENQLKRLTHEKFIGVRFEYLKVQLGQEIGRRMIERSIAPDTEIITILNKAKEIAIS